MVKATLGLEQRRHRTHSRNSTTCLQQFHIGTQYITSEISQPANTVLAIQHCSDNSSGTIEQSDHHRDIGYASA